VTQWFDVPVNSIRERELQHLFESWHTRDATLLYGVPDWLDSIDAAPVPPSQRRRRSFGYDFTPDIEFIVRRRRYVLELKHGAKYEGVALAEVLHHAAWLKRYEAEQASEVVPVIISQYNTWLRLAVDEYLRAAVRHVEVVALAGPGDTTILAFDVPLAPWTVKQPPTWLRDVDPKVARFHWHHVAETDSWFGLTRQLTARPVIMEEPYIWVMGASDRPVLLWEGLAARSGELWRSVRSEDGSMDSNGRYFLSGEGDPRSACSPGWLSDRPS
jgi:hypothetical protein